MATMVRRMSILPLGVREIGDDVDAIGDQMRRELAPAWR